MSGLFVSPGKSASPFVGVAKPFKFAAPAVGAEIDIALPGGAFYRVINGFLTFTASAAAANRIPRVRITDGTDRLFSLAVPSTIVATNVVELNLASNYGLSLSLGTGFTGTLPLPDVVIPGGFHIQTSTLAIDAGDQWSAPVLWMEELDLGPLGNSYGLIPFGAGIDGQSEGMG